ncbi:hypothetical protein A3C33_04170 [Candidatus Curtissbacteria bacterium RIFCSPHIGHO2_02_FULL_42_58]|uniref:Uncharacterized protein n=1 Tax=Candidatus Curtissbacteria bacterium RIFCSPLOWO2_01_FULL_42_50 TaxID=1797730 RepID=A0A1F5H2V5_9BACT|nr:MAG: hypothetical protein A3C33_04170 [Candidatus Curtissbacteria bacterium RIFCSPHIGHO2_02_FULL_42_58]OGD97267.1 MAG: hypothetical protein A3E71_04380 [Candidatus Curtissbacteria bacterium RIFCSPHIGHO2_12_FULL_42_33]OGD98409.1 MAG: hypothetical protein A3B54_03670 [Candidatus Curtissbacteria bacterium RIFCSPLOWO2_01_FULL_42_50]
MAERCLQSATGSCSGCHIRDGILDNRLRTSGDGLQLREVADLVGKVWCPEGMKIQAPKRVKQSIW